MLRRRRADLRRIAELEAELGLVPTAVAAHPAEKQPEHDYGGRIFALVLLMVLAGFVALISSRATTDSHGGTTYYFWRSTARLVVVCVAWGPLALAIAGLSAYLLASLVVWIVSGRHLLPESWR